MCKKLMCLMTLAFVLGLSPSVFAGTYPGRLGVNIGLPDEMAPLFVDVIKSEYRWVDTTGATLTSGQVDASGWPTVDATLVMDCRLVAEWANPPTIDDPEVYRIDNTGTYKCAFTGQATVVAGGAASVSNVVYNSSTNTTTFDYIVTSPAQYLDVQFTNTKRTPSSPTNSGFTGFKMMHPGYPVGTTQVFATDFTSGLTSLAFAAMRTYGFNYENGEATYPAQLAWADRSLMTDASQAPIPQINKLDAAAWEYGIQLANEAGINPWFNVPVSASTDYVTQLATLIKNNLSTSLCVYIESSNEVWNTAEAYLPQNNWNKSQAAALGLTEQQNYARRVAELAEIFQSVFGAGSLNTRVRVMICWHAPWISDVTSMLNWINTNKGTPKNYIYSIASQTYFGGAAATGGKGTTRYTVDQILNACVTNIDSQDSSRNGWLGVANQWQLAGGYYCYEGGPDFGGGSTANLANRITANRVARMEEVYEYNLDEHFFGLGAKLACQFTLCGVYTRYGCWGLTDDIVYPDRNWKFKGARDLVGESTYKNGDWSPIANNDAYSTNMNTTLVVAAPGVLGNDTDPDSDPLTAVLLKNVVNGTLTLNSNGSFTYTPNTGFVGTDIFEYAANDGTLKGNDGTVTITVTSSCTPTDMHVHNIVCGTINMGAGCYAAYADVTIRNDCGVAVPNVAVTGTFTKPSATVTAYTNAQGVAHLQTPNCDHNVHGTFCVTNVTGGSLPYHSADNVVTCGTY